MTGNLPEPTVRTMANIPAGRTIPVRWIGVLAASALVISILIPALYPLPKRNMWSRGLGFLYQQYNPDSPVFFYSSLRFPDYYREVPLRASRPLFALVTKPLSMIAACAVRTVAPGSRIATLKWGDRLAVEHLAIYAGWILVNAVLLWSMLLWAARLMQPYLHTGDIRLALIFLSMTPPALLTLTWMHTVIAGWAIIALSLLLFSRLSRHRPLFLPSLILGLLLLGKSHIAPLLAGTVLFFRLRDFRRWGQILGGIALPMLMWWIFCRASGIEPFAAESGLYTQGWANASFSGRVRGFLLENAIGIMLLVNPVVFILVCNGLRRVGHDRVLLWRGIVFAGFELAMLFALFRTGSIYLYDFHVVLIPLFFLGIGGDRVFNKVNAGTMPDPIVSPGLRRVLLVSQAVWLPLAIFAQTSLWRAGRWF